MAIALRSRRCAGDIEIGNAVNLAVGIDDALARVVRHAGCAHMVVAPALGLVPFVLLGEKDAHVALAPGADGAGERLQIQAQIGPVRAGEAPVDPGAVEPEGVPLRGEKDAAVRVRGLLGRAARAVAHAEQGGGGRLRRRAADEMEKGGLDIACGLGVLFLGRRIGADFLHLIEGHDRSETAVAPQIFGREHEDAADIGAVELGVGPVIGRDEIVVRQQYLAGPVDMGVLHEVAPDKPAAIAEAASATTTASARPDMIRLRRGKSLPLGWVPGGISATRTP